MKQITQICCLYILIILLIAPTISLYSMQEYEEKKENALNKHRVIFADLLNKRDLDVRRTLQKQQDEVCNEQNKYKEELKKISKSNIDRRIVSNDLNDKESDDLLDQKNDEKIMKLKEKYTSAQKRAKGITELLTELDNRNEEIRNGWVIIDKPTDDTQANTFSDMCTNALTYGFIASMRIVDHFVGGKWCEKENTLPPPKKWLNMFVFFMLMQYVQTQGIDLMTDLISKRLFKQ